MHRSIKLILIKIFPVIFFVGLALMFYWKVILRGNVPFPGDLLIGAYYPWLDYKWGNIVGVAIKNTLISDIFSQFFLWKKEILASYLNWQWPLWNPYSYSGYPLLANFNSGALNPFNALLVVFGSIKGWGAMVVVQSLLTAISMFVLLRTLNKNMMSALVGSVVYAFGGFSILWSQFVNVGYAMAWIPLIFTTIELACIRKNSKWLLLISPLFFLIVTAGHLQALVYAAVLTIAYFIYRIGVNNILFNVTFVISAILAVGLSMIQLLPSVELMNLSIRFGDSFAKEINFGLLPGKNLITMIAPDFYGNPSTGNHWGFFDYHETMTYAGVIGFISLFFGISYFKKLKNTKFFLVLAIIALLMQFDTPIGRAVYLLKIPFLWTSVAGRINMIYLLSVSVLVSEFVESIGEVRFREKIKVFLPSFLILLLGGAIVGFCLYLFSKGYERQYLQYPISNMIVGIRNIIVPGALTFILFIIISLSGKIKIWRTLILFLVIVDLFRFGWKYLPIVPKEYVYPETEITQFLSTDKSVFRIDKEYGEIMPQNTWGAYGLMSPSGYDPMAISDYVLSYNHDLNMEENPGVSRFNQLNIYDATALGKYNVKYLLVIKRDKEARIPGDIINYKINTKEWKRVFETRSMSILQNIKYQERTRVIDSQGNTTSDFAEIVNYNPNKVVIRFANTKGDKLLLADTYYPGWVATINGKQTKIGSEVKPFRTVDIRGIKAGEIVFEYKPSSFIVGMWISIVSLIVWIGLCVFENRNRNKS